MSDLASAEPLPPSQWDPSLAHVLEDMKGKPLNVHSLMANHPELLKAWWSFRNYSVQGGALGQRLGELVILRVALHMRAWYEWASHLQRAQACGLTLEEIERVKLGGDAPGWDPGEAALLKAVDELVATRGLSPESHAALLAHYSVRQIMDIMAIQGMYIILGCMINTWGLPLDQAAHDALPQGVTEEQFKADYPR